LNTLNRDVVREQVEDIAKNNLNEVKNTYKEILGDFNIQEFIEKTKNWDEFTREIKRDVGKACREKAINHFFNILFFYSVLLDADKLDASGTSIPKRIKNVKKIIVDDYKKKTFGSSRNYIDKIREEAYKDVNGFIKRLNLREDRILAINLPTGMGKTLTGLSFSLGLRERVKEELGFTPRIIYCLPFLSIIDQNSDVIKNVFETGGKRKYIPSNLLLKHHHLVDIVYEEEKDGELDPLDLNRSLLLMEGWNSEVIITTFVQFFHSLITNRNRAARKFHNILNSIIILDEIQSIPHKYWLLINKSLKHLVTEFNCRIILMTATQPLIFEENKEIKHLVKNKERYFKASNRVDFIFDLNNDGKFNEIEFDLFKKKFFDEIIKNENVDFMVVLNTIDSCKRLYEYLKKKLVERYNLDAEKSLDEDGICCLPDMELINLSTNILPLFRLKRINRIKKRMKRKVVITTQLVEAGVDISVDVVYRDLAPLDCVIQSAGRCNRNNKKEKGKIHVVLLKDENGRKFCSYIYDPLLIGVTQELVGEFGRKPSEKDFVANATEKYYRLVKERGTRDVSKEILGYIRKLNFTDTTKFRLIEEKLRSVSIFIEIDEKAEKTREEVQRILSLEKGFKRREKLLEMRRKLNENTISVRCSQKTESIESLPFLEGEFFRYVPRRELDDWYKLDTGFYVSEKGVRII
jgi:CRISPR-associated endonuclease/helicase Cas3